MFWASFLWKRESWRAFWRQRGLILPLIFSISALAVIWAIVAIVPISQDESLSLRYSIYVGTNWIVEPRWFWLIPAVGTSFVLINVILAYLVGRKTLTLQYIWLWSAAFLAGGFLWLTLLLAWLNS